MNLSTFREATAATSPAACAVGCGDTPSTARPAADAPAFTSVRREIGSVWKTSSTAVVSVADFPS